MHESGGHSPPQQAAAPPSLGRTRRRPPFSSKSSCPPGGPGVHGRGACAPAGRPGSPLSGACGGARPRCPQRALTRPDVPDRFGRKLSPGPGARQLPRLITLDALKVTAGPAPAPRERGSQPSRKNTGRPARHSCQLAPSAVRTRLPPAPLRCRDCHDDPRERGPKPGPGGMAGGRPPSGWGLRLPASWCPRPAASRGDSWPRPGQHTGAGPRRQSGQGTPRPEPQRVPPASSPAGSTEAEGPPSSAGLWPGAPQKSFVLISIIRPRAFHSLDSCETYGGGATCPSCLSWGHWCPWL